MNNKKNNILILNGGSSSLKFSLYNKKLELLLKGIVEQIGGKSSMKYKNIFFKNKEKELKNIKINTRYQALKQLNKILVQEEFSPEDISDLGYRVVHGGDKYKQIHKITKKIEKDIETYSDLAPLHNPFDLMIIKAAKKAFPKKNHWAIFDTGFYNDLPDKAKLYALPYAFYKKHKIQRYGFHGTSHAYILEETAKKLKKKPNQLNIISCHLGSGASVTAIKKGKAIDTSMGFTPLEGLMMSTRSGDIDAGIIIYLQKKLKLSESTINNILNKESGWLGISGYKDMREVLCLSDYKIPGYKCLEERRKYKEECDRCKLALKMFVYRLTKYIGAYSLILGKVDAIVLTAGIGERSKIIFNLLKKEIAPLLKQKVKYMQIATDEELMMARYVKKESK